MYHWARLRKGRPGMAGQGKPAKASVAKPKTDPRPSTDAHAERSGRGRFLAAPARPEGDAPLRPRRVRRGRGLAAPELIRG